MFFKPLPTLIFFIKKKKRHFKYLQRGKKKKGTQLTFSLPASLLPYDDCWGMLTKSWGSLEEN